MSVHVTDTSDPQAWVIAADECGHTGTAPASSLKYGQNPDGTENRDLIVIPCPVCATTSYWPRETLAQDIQEKLPA